MGENRSAFALRGILLAALFVLLLGSQACFAYNPGDPEFRGIYVDAWHAGARNAAEIDQLIADAHYCRANTIVIEVRRRGDTIYPSIEPTCSGFSPSFDALADLIQKAHNTSPRLDVQAWFVMMPVESDPATTDPNHPYNKYPQYLTKTDTGETSIAGDFWWDPGHPGAEQYLCNLVMDVVNRYDVDGINFDYIRFGYYNAGYNDTSVARFNSFSSRYGGDFNTWRREQLTNLVRKIYANAIAVKPNLKVTADCVCGTPAPGNLAEFQSSSQAYTKYYQNWPGWMQEGILDMSITMAYFDCYGEYGHCYDPWTCFTRNYRYNRQSAVAPGLYSASCLTTQLDHTRTLACGATNGAAVYAYAGLDAAMKNAIRAVWTSNAPIPAMPWKSAPTKGHIKGSVTFGGATWIDGATVSITGPGTTRTMYADGTGFFAFIDLPAGDYNLTCTATGYGVITQSVHVNVGQVTTANCDYPVSTLIISNIQASETSNGATITWTTNAGSSSKVYYGLDKTCSSSTTENTTQVSDHSVTLSGLLPGTVYYFKVYSKNGTSGPMAMSEVCALVTVPSSPADIIIESRSGGKNYGWYSDVSATGDSGAKSSAAGCTAGIGSRYLSISASYAGREANYRPAIPQTGNYKVYVTWGTSSSGGSNIKHTVTYSGGSYTTSFNHAANSNTWQLIGTFPFVAGPASTYGVKQWADAIESGKRITADAVKFEWANTDSTPPTMPTNLAATNIQDDSIALGWTASTDNISVAGYRISRGLSSTVNVVDVSPTNSFVDTDVLANTRYWYAVSAYDGSGNRSATTSTMNLWSMCPKPTTANIACDKQSGVWHAAGPFTFSAIGGFGPGYVGYYRYAFDTSPSHTWTGSEATWIVGTKACPATTSALPYYLHIKGYNQANSPGEASDLGPYYVDSTPPEAPAVIDGKYTVTSNTIYASWHASDPESGIKQYEYAVGTSPLGTQTKGWTNAGADTSATISGLSLVPDTTYYVSVRATNNAGLLSSPASSTGFQVALSVANILDAKALDNGKAVSLAPQVVSAVFPTAFYLEDPDRFTAIRVQSESSLAPNDVVSVMGKMGVTADGERAILDPVFPPPTTTGNPIAPMIILSRAAGGGTQGKNPGITSGVGLNTSGLLVKVAGRVTSVVDDGYYLDDGSGLTDGIGNGIKIWTGTSGSAGVDTWLTVTGVVSFHRPVGDIYAQVLQAAAVMMPPTAP